MVGGRWDVGLVARLDRLEVGVANGLKDTTGCSSWGSWKVGSTQVESTLRGDMAAGACTCCCSLNGCRLVGGYVL